ncbi:hypothetical protein GE061_013994 [Apolygus lucorum]|uniref:Uncharacterized protein n=1 Tax=Apolygus lucorum TaxID=248454 RepID=A0A8S9XPL2_APOLU|nr:hypothetical protein GE061_013994 [Apolygus lucorum]
MDSQPLSSGMSNPKPAIARGKALRSQAREIVYNVFQYFTTKKNDDNTKYNVHEVTSEATGVSARTVGYIMKEAGNRTASDCTGPLFVTPTKSKPHKKVIAADEFTDAAIRNKIREFYTVRKECPTLKTLCAALASDEVLDM